jgi:hypothetical protein
VLCTAGYIKVVNIHLHHVGVRQHEVNDTFDHSHSLIVPQKNGVSDEDSNEDSNEDSDENRNGDNKLSC